LANSVDEIKEKKMSNLKANYPFNGNANDESGNGYNGTVNGATLTTDRFGNADSAYSFDGTDDYIELASTQDVDVHGGNFTVAAWIKGDSFSSGDHTIIGTDEGGTSQRLHFVIRDKKPYMGFLSNDTASSTVLSTDTWYHIVWRYTVGIDEQAIFINGVLDTSETGHFAFHGGGNVMVGRHTYSNYFDGKIDDLRFYNSAFSDDAIKSLYHSLVARYP
jgi:hypothetical protein